MLWVHVVDPQNTTPTFWNPQILLGIAGRDFGGDVLPLAQDVVRIQTSRPELIFHTAGNWVLTNVVLEFTIMRKPHFSLYTHVSIW